MFKPELLLPAGSLETFFAAMEGGADAVYLGLKKFNARNRARNFSYNDLLNVVNEAHLRGKKVYVTLNTLLKNNELPELIETLTVLSQCRPDALIVQDLAVANLVTEYFPKLQIHASTQMAIHNSASCNWLKDRGFSRVVLARELTLHELAQLVKSADVETEVFIHGALCYSVSGQCLFSSYLGGNSANRGLCTQVCRRNFIAESGKTPLFSMKDFQLVDLVPAFADMKISSLKVEGRMKTPDYVYNVARAYRMAIDDHSKIDDAKEILDSDFAREKTLWFMGHDVKNSTTSNSETGIYVGKICELKPDCILVESNVEISPDAKLRCRNNADTEADFIRINGLSCETIQLSNPETEKPRNLEPLQPFNPSTFQPKNFLLRYSISCDSSAYSVGQDIYLVGHSGLPFKTKFQKPVSRRFDLPSHQKVDAIRRSFQIVGSRNNDIHLFLRVSSVNILKKLNPGAYDAIYLKSSLEDAESLLSVSLPRETRQKVFVELPKYISERQIADWKLILSKLAASGLNRFVLSNISQQALVPPKSIICTNEHVYLMNDIAVNFAKSEHVRSYCYPLESDYPNLISGRDRGGIIPIYFYPELFFSRQPVPVSKFTDENKTQYLKSVNDGYTIITDSNPVSWTQNVTKFRGKGFCRFLIDLSRENDLSRLSEILLAVKNSVKIPKTSDFNMKKGLK